MTKEEFIARKKAITQSETILWNEVDEHAQEEKRVVNLLENAATILDQLDEQFEKQTQLTKLDMAFLMFAVGLQALRIYLLPKFQEKLKDEERLAHNDESIKEMEHKNIQEYKEKHQNKWAAKKSEKGYRSWQEIAFTIKVPYDATRHSSKVFDRNMRGGLHRVKTLGHDPWLGWIFGVANILSDSITICPEYKLREKSIRLPKVESYVVDMRTFTWHERISTIKILENAIESVKEDRHRLYAAVFAQSLHLTSDMYTKLGLPIPFLSLLDSDKAYDIYKGGYDYMDLKFDTQILRRTAKSAAQSMLINAIIGSVHSLFYNPTEEPNRELYSVRTHKIILYSNIIATSSDILQTAIRASIGEENAIKNFDLGGFLVTLYRIVHDIQFIQKIKEEFIFNKWDNILMNNNYA
jgi:hypothetical protein